MVNFRKICAALLVGAVLPALAVTGSPSDTSDGRSQWFVKLKTTDVTDEQINQQIKNAGGDTHSRIIRIPDIYLAYSALLDDTKIKELREDKFVERAEKDELVEFAAIKVNSPAISHLALISQKCPYGRIGFRKGEYYYDEAAGEDQDIYIIDSGVEINHVEFGKRAVIGKHFEPGGDKSGHGTHVAGLAASKTFGVATKANVISVKVDGPDDQTISSQIVEGLWWATNNALVKGRAEKSVINISLGVPHSDNLDEMVQIAFEHGLLVVAAAGNYGKDAMTLSPASSPFALTVGAATNDRRRASWSNYGRAVDVYAPGMYCTSTCPDLREDIDPSALKLNEVDVRTGSSMAAGYVSGLVAYLRSVESGLEKPADVMKRVIELAYDVFGDSDPHRGKFVWNGAMVCNGAPPMWAKL